MLVAERRGYNTTRQMSFSNTNAIVLHFYSTLSNAFIISLVRCRHGNVLDTAWVIYSLRARWKFLTSAKHFCIPATSFPLAYRADESLS